MSTSKILVCCHKPSPYIRQDEIYTPIQVGAALSSVDLGYLRDDFGGV